MAVLDDFLKYVKIDTQSCEESEETPSTKKQYDLLNLLKKELDELGVLNELDEFGRLYGFVNGNEKYDTIGLCAHVDTAGECSGKDVKPQIVVFNGDDIKLGNSGLVLSQKDFPFMKDLIGKTLVTTDGTTLLGADDKAGVAIIMNVVKDLLKQNKDSHAPISILFTPDEEVGRGPEHFNKEKFRAKYGYTIDGGGAKYVSIENFNAASAQISVTGKSIHPGSAKGVMINAILVMNYFMNQLPKDMIPSKTDGREGFNHIVYIRGDVEHAETAYILRNHDGKILEQQKQMFIDAKEATLKEYPGAIIDLNISDSYRNMYEIIEKNPECKNKIDEVYKKMGVDYVYEPIRGGTDGATFSFMGVPCPNLGTGGYNCHGRYEFAVVEEMELMVKIVKEFYSL